MRHEQQRKLSQQKQTWNLSVSKEIARRFTTGKKAGISLILEFPKDRKFFIRLNSTIQHFSLSVDNWEMVP